MGFTLKGRRITAWIACFAILLLSLAPSVSHALAAPDSTVSFTEICSVAGLKTVKADSPVPSSPHQQLHFEHCPYCSLHAGSFAILPSFDLAMPVADKTALRPLLFFQARHVLFAWSTAQPRAPPARS